MRRILILNGSIGGATGNTAAALTLLTQSLEGAVQVEIAHLSESYVPSDLHEKIKKADAFVFATGTYWDSWGSPLQAFLEQATDLEASDAWVGKPAALVVTMHSVGGKEVLSRLQGVLVTLGLFIPPMSGMVYSFANQLALEARDKSASHFASDLWRLEDLKVIAGNLLAALELTQKNIWQTWPVDDSDPRRLWLKLP